MLHLATVADLPDIISMTAAAVRSLRTQGIEQWDEIYPDRSTFEADIAVRSLFLYRREQGLAGCICVNADQLPEYAPVAWKFTHDPIQVVHRLIVHPDFQGQGHSRIIMAWAEDYVARSGGGSIRLDAFIHNPVALRLYEKLGYCPAGIVALRKGPFMCFEKAVPGR